MHPHTFLLRILTIVPITFGTYKIFLYYRNYFNIIKDLAEFGKIGKCNQELGKFKEPEVFTLYKCPTCGDITILKKTYENVVIEDLDEPDYVEKHQIIVYPMHKLLDDNIIPVDICNIYEEAMSLKKISPNSFGIQIRRALEFLCEEQGAPKSGELYNKLKKLSERNIFPENIIEMGNIIRKVAKYGAHPKDEEITTSDADLLDDIFHLILDYVYITPHKVKALQEKFEKVNK